MVDRQIDYLAGNAAAYPHEKAARGVGLGG